MSLVNNFSRAAEDCALLSYDIRGMIDGIKNNKKSSKTSLEPVTRLRKNTEELIEVQNAIPDEQFIADKLKDVFKGR